MPLRLSSCLVQRGTAGQASPALPCGASASCHWTRASAQATPLQTLAPVSTSTVLFAYGTELRGEIDLAISSLIRIFFRPRQVGKFPDVLERLIDGHLAKGDEASALVTADWYQGGHFNGWSRPSAFASQLLERLGKRPDEARDAARVALAKGPWYTMGVPVAGVVARAGFGGMSAAEVKKKMNGALPHKSR